MERPILFNTDMVKAILEGRKTQTRRIVKPQPITKGTTFLGIENGEAVFDEDYPAKAPYSVGDILWVREAWNKLPFAGTYLYKAEDRDTDTGEYTVNPLVKWKPSIHMPRAAARLFLKVTDVRVERLQDITENGAKAEGAEKAYRIRDTIYHNFKDKDNYRDGFSQLWNSCYNWPKTWSANPWVWVIEFERMV